MFTSDACDREESTTMKFSKTTLRILLLIFVIRLALSLLPSFEVDMSAWLAWAYRLAELGTSRFYSDEVWTQYTPGFLYWLLWVGKLGWVDPLMIKIPVILADIATALLIGRIVGAKSQRVNYWIFILYVLNPVVIFDGSVWGQVDGILTLAMMAATYYLVERKNVIMSFGLLGVALLVKLQAIAIVPVMLIYTLVTFGFTQLVLGSVLMGGVVIIGFYPFYPANPLAGMLDLVTKMGVSYPYTSLFAYNVWSYVGIWKLDSTIYKGLSYFHWGVVMMASAFLIVAVRFFRTIKDRRYVYLVFALSCLIFYLFPTRVHERYLYPFFAYLMTATYLLKNKYLTISLVIMSLIYVLNLYVPYSHYAPITNSLKSVDLETAIGKLQPLIAATYLAVLTTLIVGGLFPGRKKLKQRLPVETREREAIKHRHN